MAHTVLRLPAVIARTGLSRSSIYKFVAEGRFPAPSALGARSVGWVEMEIDESPCDGWDRSGGLLRPQARPIHASTRIT